ncbi:hypothetical protein SAMN03159405_01052, partial [Pseudomonas sp. NFACC44-2]
TELSGLGAASQPSGSKLPRHRVAWRHSGGEAQSDTRQENPQLLAQIGYSF